MLSNAVKAARRAGNIITRASEDIGSLKIQTKTYNDFVTEVDKAAEQAIIETLKELYPTHGFLGEESGESNIESDFIWIIDPLSQPAPGRRRHRGDAGGDLVGIAGPDAGAHGYRLDQLSPYAGDLSPVVGAAA